MKILKFIKRKILNFFKSSNFSLILNLKKKVTGISILDNAKGLIISFSSNSFLSFNIRPKLAKNFNLISTEHADKEKFGILVQGPIEDSLDRNFVYNTMKIYEKIFPNSQIILSTWEGTDTAILENEFKKLNIIKNKLPKKSGFLNINYQIESTAAGINSLKNMEIENVLKTRTDTRIMKPNTISFLLSLQKNFEISNQKYNRIFSCNLLTTKFRPYGLSDLILFGKTSDLEIYFKNEDEDSTFKKHNFVQIINDTAVGGEVFLCSRYLENIGEKLDWSLPHWWSCLIKYFGVFNFYDIDLFWKKYDWRFENRGVRNYSNLSHRCFDFSDWISLYYEKKLNLEKVKYKEKHTKVNNKIVKDKFY